MFGSGLHLRAHLTKVDHNPIVYWPAASLPLGPGPSKANSANTHGRSHSDQTDGAVPCARAARQGSTRKAEAPTAVSRSRSYPSSPKAC
jgi:hypothetical protein